jgi:tRNA-binding protein
MLTREDFDKVEMRVGTIVEAREFPRARKPSYRLIVDFGLAGRKPSSAQFTALYTPEELVGKQVVAVVNFPPKNIAGFSSECLVLGVLRSEGEVVVLTTERPVPDGQRVF